ncbi:YtoQ family protein [Alteribacillus iranensis]|uniref:YtoQ family protein n=1 Tax=Alteribacillus iranensis TaxID=930128 RepID=A0A1I2ETF2_9BACI|nr:YtoQ family protein [Alteribacillus iranensis]SFE95601.1 YtoQ family protein [Alteribacillus iranensis]
MELNVYLAGQIHDDWREELRAKSEKMGLPLHFLGPMENHERSDNIGEEILGEQPDNIFKDEAASSLNNLRTQILMQKADVVIALFGEKYKQWNTAMDAGAAAALGKPLIVIRPEELHHPVKEIANKSQLTVESMDQALQALSYIFETK